MAFPDIDTSVMAPGGILSPMWLDAALALLSAAAYDDNANLAADLSEIGLSPLGLPGFSDGTLESANAAMIAYEGSVGGLEAVFLAFRGTDDFGLGAGGALSAYLGSADAAAWFDTDAYYDLLSAGIAAVDAYVAAAGTPAVFVTGHSLGGAAAQAYMAEHPATAATGYQAVTFGATGMSEGVATDPRVVQYVEAGDPANLIGTQTGSTQVVFHASQDMSLGGLDLAGLLGDPASIMSVHGLEVYVEFASSLDAVNSGAAGTETMTWPYAVETGGASGAGLDMALVFSS